MSLSSLLHIDYRKPTRVAWILERYNHDYIFEMNGESIPRSTAVLFDRWKPNNEKPVSTHHFFNLCMCIVHAPCPVLNYVNFRILYIIEASLEIEVHVISTIIEMIRMSDRKWGIDTNAIARHDSEPLFGILNISNCIRIIPLASILCAQECNSHGLEGDWTENNAADNIELNIVLYSIDEGIPWSHCLSNLTITPFRRLTISANVSPWKTKKSQKYICQHSAFGPTGE